MCENFLALFWYLKAPHFWKGYLHFCTRCLKKLRTLVFSAFGTISEWDLASQGKEQCFSLNLRKRNEFIFTFVFFLNKTDLIFFFYCSSSLKNGRIIRYFSFMNLLEKKRKRSFFLVFLGMKKKLFIPEPVRAARGGG